MLLVFFFFYCLIYKVFLFLEIVLVLCATHKIGKLIYLVYIIKILFYSRLSRLGFNNTSNLKIIHNFMNNFKIRSVYNTFWYLQTYLCKNQNVLESPKTLRNNK